MFSLQFSPLPGENDPIWRAYFFQMGGYPHQLGKESVERPNEISFLSIYSKEFCQIYIRVRGGEIQ